MTTLAVAARAEAARARQVCGLAGIATAAALVGAGTAAAAVRYGPWVVVAVAAALAAVAAVLCDVSLVVLGLLLVLPLGPQPIGPASVVHVAAALVVGVVVAWVIGTGRPWGTPAAVLVPLGVVLASGGLSAGLSGSPGTSVAAWLQHVLGAGLMVSVAAAVDTRAQLRRLVSVLVGVGASIAAAAALSVDQLSVSYGGAAVSGRAHGIFGQPNELGAFTSAIVVLALALWLGSRSFARSAFALTCLVALFSALLLSLSRGAWIGASAGVLALSGLCLGHRAVRRRLTALCFGLAVAAVGAEVVVRDQPLVGALTARLSSLGDSGSNPDDARGDIYDEAIGDFLTAPPIGRGPGTFPELYAGSATTGREGDADHAHNLVLTVGVEFGPLGLLAFAALCTAVLAVGVVTLRRLSRSGHLADSVCCAGLVAALVTVLAHGIVDYPLRNAVLFLLYWLIAGLILGYARVTSPDPVARAGGALP